MITYNHEEFVSKAIESVLAQRTSFPIELVIGDDASSDYTCRRIEALRAQAPGVIRLLTRATNIGVHGNLQGVLEECRGEFVAFLEGDDYWTCDEKLEIQVGILRKNERAVGVFHPVTVVDSLCEETGTIHPWQLNTEVRTQELLGTSNIIPTPSVMIRRNALVELPESYRKLKMRDLPIWVHASLIGPWLFFPEVMAAYRVHNGGVWNCLSAAERRNSTVELFEALAAELPLRASAIARRGLTQLHLRALEEAIADDRRADARREMREIFPLLLYCRMTDSRRLFSALWRAWSPGTHRAARRMLRAIR